MEMFTKKYDKECMKMAMLNHEKTFREQVNELHRLYRVQKILMRDLMMSSALQRHQQVSDRRNGDLRRWDPENQTSFFPRAQERRKASLDLERPAEEYAEDDGENAAEEESEIELTLATGSRARKKEETSLTSESGASFSSSSTESGGDNPKFQDWGLPQIAGMNRNFPGVRNTEHPPWLYQCLSLNIA
ncbi:unnamed protein product [Spirodela intermedia]|uniref:Uncharacterized protein n=1 Tax=Spirodela intermedia TaxID=51605 RepID=A0A7I8II83_SPIIN|nr:unnamed protein product [Spirodela intermedia]CAA6657504.1 unnamed protein product [Spirodela intermedia]